MLVNHETDSPLRRTLNQGRRFQAFVGIENKFALFLRTLLGPFPTVLP